MRFMLGFGAQVLDPYALAAGESVPTRLNPLGLINLTSQRLHLSYFTAARSEVVSQARVWSGTVPSVLDSGRLGVYAIDSAGGGQLVAATVTDPTLFSVASTKYVRSYTAAWQKIAGQRYAMATLVVGATVGNAYGLALGLAQESGEPPRVCGVINGQADLPVSFTEAQVSAAASFLYGAVLP